MTVSATTLCPNVRNMLEMQEQARTTFTPRNMLDPEKYAYPTPAAFVLARGHETRAAVLTDEEFDRVRYVAHGMRFPIKQCFSNSQMFLNRAIAKGCEKDFQYVEGYCWTGFWAIQHGWIETTSGKIVDVTLRLASGDPQLRRGKQARLMRDRVIGDFKCREYLGVTFTWDQIRRRVVKGEWGTLIDWYEEGWPFLKKSAA